MTSLYNKNFKKKKDFLFKQTQNNLTEMEKFI